MQKLPSIVGLTLCEQIVVAEKTRNVSLINTFNRLQSDSFPSRPQRFVVYATLTDGLGDGTMSLMVMRPDTLEGIFEYHWPVRFLDPLRSMRVALRCPALVLPVPGRYQVCLSVDRELLAQTAFTAFVQEKHHGEV